MLTQPTLRFGAAVLAGTLVLFVWGGFSHLVLIKGTGFDALPNEDAVLGTLKSTAREGGLYFFPSLPLRETPSERERAAWESKYRAGPTGMLVVRPGGEPPVSARKLAVQCLSHFLAALLLTHVAGSLGASYLRRALTLGSLGAFAWLTISTIYWNWYGYPLAFFLAQGLDQIAGAALAGFAIAAIVPPAGRLGGEARV